MAKTITNEEIKRQAIQLVENERNEWEDAVAFVTDKIAFNMRNLIKTLRKNYYGIFDEQDDPTTGAKKVWTPLTESTVEGVVKNIDLDTKDINFRTKKPDARGVTAFIRNLVKDKLDQMYFGEYLDEMERSLAIDGTVVWKTYVTQESGKKTVRIKQVDLLNFYIDPTADSIQETGAVIERAVMTPNELMTMDGWYDTEDIQGSVNVSRNDKDLMNMTGGEVEMIDVYERWGLMPKNLLTGKKKDGKEMVEGHIVISGLETKDLRVHLIEENTQTDGTKKVVKPYEEFRYKKVPGRWYGRGIAEMVMFLQLWINTIVNIRIVRSRVSQLGLFKIKKGSGVTSQMLSRLSVNGAVVVNNMQDIEQFVVQEASQSSYLDEEKVQDWAQKVTSAYESVTGEGLPASTPATNAVLQSRIAQNTFVMVKEQIGMGLQRWLKRHFIPLLGETITKGEIIAVTGESDEMKDLDTKVTNKLIFDQLKEMQANNVFPDPMQVKQEQRRVKDKLRGQGAERFVELMKMPETTDYDVQVFITNEEIDKAVILQNMINIIPYVAQIPGLGVDPAQVILTALDVMGFDPKQFESQMNTMIAAPSEVPQIPVPTENRATSTEQRIVTAANTAGITQT